MSNESIFVVGCGRSFRGFDVEKLRGHGLLIAVNDAALLLPWCDIAFTADEEWQKKRREDVCSLLDKSGTEVWWGAHYNARNREPWIPQGVNLIRWMRGGSGLALETDMVYGSNSGRAALNLAVHFSPKRIFLLGFDLNVETKDSKLHWHDGYLWGNGPHDKLYPDWAKEFDACRKTLAVTGVEVYNCNPNSNITTFRKDVTYDHLPMRSSVQKRRDIPA